MSILEETDFPAIRAAIDIELDKTVLPDATIALPIFQGEGEYIFATAVAAAVPPVDTTLQTSKNACIYYIAALLSLKLSQYVSETFQEYRYQKTQIPQDQLAFSLFAQGDTQVARLLGLDEALATAPNLLRVAHGRRMR